MHVVMFSDLESTHGGATIATSRLAEALCALGHRVTRLVNSPDGQGHLRTTKEHPWTTKSLAPLYRHFVGPKTVRRIVRWTPFRHLASLNAQHSLGRVLARLRPDVINVHNLHAGSAIKDGWDPRLLLVCYRYAPTVWTLHDMWSFTGGCAYSYDCRRFTIGCNSFCQNLPLNSKLIASAWMQRKKLLSQLPNLVAVCPSTWLAQEACAGLWSGHRVLAIPNGLSLKTYQPIDRNVARAALRISTPGPVLLTAAQDLTSRRKGGQILVEAIKRVLARPLTLVTLGRCHPEFPFQANGLHVHHLGYVDDERIKALAYSMSDVLIHPAPVDNLPNTIMEAIACGTPVVGFATGGVSDMIRPGQTGWLTYEISGEALAKTIDKALDDIHRGMNLRISCRSIAEAEYDSFLQARRYSDLFESMQ